MDLAGGARLRGDMLERNARASFSKRVTSTTALAPSAAIKCVDRWPAQLPEHRAGETGNKTGADSRSSDAGCYQHLLSPVAGSASCSRRRNNTNNDRPALSTGLLQPPLTVATPLLRYGRQHGTYVIISGPPRPALALLVGSRQDDVIVFGPDLTPDLWTTRRKVHSVISKASTAHHTLGLHGGFP